MSGTGTSKDPEAGVNTAGARSSETRSGSHGGSHSPGPPGERSRQRINHKSTKQLFALMHSLASEDTLITHAKKKWSNNQLRDLGMKAEEMDSSFGDARAINPRLPSCRPALCSGAVRLPPTHQEAFPLVNCSGWWCRYDCSYPPASLCDLQTS